MNLNPDVVRNTLAELVFSHVVNASALIEEKNKVAALEAKVEALEAAAKKDAE